MRALKMLVIVMGVMLVVGIVALGFGIAYRVNHPRGMAPLAARAVIAPDGVAHIVALPVGGKIIAVQSDGSRVMIRLGLANGEEELELLDWKTGATISKLDLK